MAAQAAALAPERSGLLAFSIAISEKGTRRAQWRQARNVMVAPGVFQGVRQSGITMAMGPSGPLAGQLNYASFVEFGTVDTPAQPYMRPSWDAQKDTSLRIMKETLSVEIRKAADRAGRKAARAGR